MADDQVHGSGAPAWGSPQQPGPGAPQGYPQPAQPGYTQPAQPGYAQPGYAQPMPNNQQGPYPPQGAYAPQAGYGQQGYYGQPATPKTPPIAIVGLVLAFLLPLVGLIVSIVALGKTKKAGAGRGLAVAGTIIGAVLTVVAGIVIFLVVNVFGALSGPRDAFNSMQHSLENADCDAFLASTTPRFQEQLGVGTCDDFDVLMQASAGGPVPFGNVPITGVEMSGDTATVSTKERVPTGDGTATTVEEFDYTVIRQDGEWLVDYVAYAN